MSEPRYHEGLEIYSDSAAHAPEVSPHGVYSQGSKEPIAGYVQVVEARKGPFGLSILSLCAIVAIITAVVVGAGVGGGLGSALANCKNSQMSEAPATSAIQTPSCPTLTSSASDTTEMTESKLYEPKPADQVTNLTLPDACSQPNGKDDYTTNNGYVFTYTCGFDYPGNDIVAILAYTAFDSAQPQKHRSFSLQTTCQDKLFQGISHGRYPFETALKCRFTIQSAIAAGPVTESYVTLLRQHHIVSVL
ncbi:hypothetical protein FANTH_1047 [Fusarium anthophilum]|uniref:Uncharacterized protein n=1 Tax=Fusarium anthophilum TaxID=48485 RepID=A0A8H5EBH1_9HYPO|nr:hypothetical protein FANTH_1047 [Fusarium anthophilum]